MDASDRMHSQQPGGNSTPGCTEPEGRHLSKSDAGLGLEMDIQAAPFLLNAGGADATLTAMTRRRRRRRRQGI